MLILFLKHCPKHLIVSEKEAVYLIAYACWLVGWLILATFLKVKKFTLQEYYLNVLIILPTFQKLPARAVYDFKAQTSK